jgi:Ca-activated chloride channel family protein
MSDYAPDWYQVLGVSVQAAPEDIRAAYRALARRFHPDVNSNPGVASQFREIVTAYGILNDSIERQRYDSKREADNGLQALTLRVTLSQRSLSLLNEPQVLYVLAELLPERVQSLKQMETRLNLTLVLDHSVSMRGQRLDRLKAAAYQIIEQLNNQDIFGVVGFSDRADVLVPSGPLKDKAEVRAQIAIMQATGGTEIFQGLQAGMTEARRHASRKYVNHIILLTDGRTYGDEPQALELADHAAKEGIGISAMGIGDEWNDTFLDQLASRTGGTSEYINSPATVVRFLNDKVRALGQSYAERLKISIAPDADIKLESAFRLSPNAQPVDINSDPILLGALQLGGIASALFQLQIGPLATPGFRSLLRIDATGDVLRQQRFGYKVVQDISTEVITQSSTEEPPLAIIDALNKLTLYRMHEKAEQALARGDVREATRRLETLATRLFSSGQPELAQAAVDEAQRVASTSALSDGGQKALKYGTRLLIGATASAGSDTQSLKASAPENS